jgi:membrane associated rhomboid family serine protease
MIPLSDENPTLRTPVMTIAILGAMAASWLLLQGAGFDDAQLAKSVCNLGMVPGELTGKAPLGQSVPIGPDMACVVDNEPINKLTPLTSMFLHGSWSHFLGNALFFWVFGNNIEDSMGRGRFLVFYLVCGFAADVAHAISAPASPVPTVGASGAISGVMGAYLLLYPRVRVRMLVILVFYITVVRVPAWAVLLWWFFIQVVATLPQLMQVNPDVAGGGVAVWAHIGGFVVGVALVRLFVNDDLHRRRLGMGDARAAFSG